MSTPSGATHRIAVYGSLRQGEYNYSTKMGDPIVTGWIKKAQLFSLGVFPCIVATDNNMDAVRVEVYDLPIDQFKDIESMELGAGYQRRPVVVELPDDGQDTMNAEAYFYPEVKTWFADARIESGDWSLRGETK